MLNLKVLKYYLKCKPHSLEKKKTKRSSTDKERVKCEKNCLTDDYTTPMAQPQPTRVSSLSFPTTILWSPQATTSSGLSPLQGSNVPQQSDNCTALASEQLLSAFHPPKPTVQEAANNNNDLLKGLFDLTVRMYMLSL